MLKISNTLLKCLKTNRPSILIYSKFSSSPNPQPTTNNADTKLNRPQNKIVAEAFASLQDEGSIKTPETDLKISEAASVEELLSLAEGNGISRKHAFNIVSMLAQWTAKGQVRLKDFENDGRFLRLCRLLTKNNSQFRNKVNVETRSEDLSTILSVTADDEAAKLVSTITLPQMVRVMTTLSLRKRRSTSLLRALAYNITASNEQLDLKQSADLLYNIASLNFPDENLLAKACNDILEHLNDPVRTTAVFGSILTSMGLLKYKNPVILDALSAHIQKTYKTWRPQDIFSYFITLASVNYTPQNAKDIFEILIPQLDQKEARKPVFWLDVVWSLTVLDQATSAHIESVLNQSFLTSLDKYLTNSTKLKLINVDGAAEYLIKDYKGFRLPPDSVIFNVSFDRSKEKRQMVTALQESLKSLIQSEQNLKLDVNSGLGFYIDAKCILDKKCNSLPVNKTNEARTDVLKIAVMAFDYHDMCFGKLDLTGVNVLAVKLLEAQGYKVLAVPYTEFKSTDKLIQRVQVIEQKLKQFVLDNL